MRMPKIHTQIIIGLILGAIFGAIFHVSQTKLILTYNDETGAQTIAIDGYERLELQIDDQNFSYTQTQNPLLLRKWQSLTAVEKKRAHLRIFRADSSSSQTYQNIREIRRENTIATAVKPIGTIFIRLLSLIAIPLVLGSLIVGAASLGDVKKVARIGMKTFGYYISTTVIAISIGVVIANVLQPGTRINDESKQLLMAEYQPDIQKNIEETLSVDVVNMLVEMIPTNPFKAIASGEMLQIVFFAVLFGIMLTFIKAEKARPLIHFFDGLSETMIELVQKVMLIAPYAVFALIAATVAAFGFGILQTLIWYFLCVIGAMLIHIIFIYPIYLKIFTPISIREFFRGIRPAQLVAFSTSSSAATLPVNFECCEDNLKVPKSITSFVLPLGATINMDGTALYQGVAAIFIAQIYGFDLSLAQQLTVILTATLASIGTAPVPGVGIIMLIIVLKSIHVPGEGIALILGVDRLLDMCRTVLNITGDATGCVIVSATEARRQARMKI
ncbi:dicarboxylate/amino acid:cation symporter [candidate division KSB1 bacterium]|nr:dicarboxylate/amino acid:cation symporter [candidate division KSB1 bacterium]